MSPMIALLEPIWGRISGTTEAGGYILFVNMVRGDFRGGGAGGG